MLVELEISHFLMLPVVTLLDNYNLCGARLDQFNYFIFSFLVLFGAILINSLHLKNLQSTITDLDVLFKG